MPIEIPFLFNGKNGCSKERTEREEKDLVWREKMGKSLSQRGVAMVLALFFVLIASGLILAGTILMQSSKVENQTNFRVYGQATSFARAGLIEALSWYRRQSTQPVTVFNPIRDLNANPPILDTDDPSIGLVRDFEISGALWGRYEVPKTEVEDISEKRGCSAGSGIVWKLISKGYVYKKVSPSVPFNQSPNQILSRGKLITEIRRMSLTPPAQAAICAPNGSSIQVTGNNARVMGDSFPALAYLRNTGSPTVTGEAQGGTYIIPPDPGDPIPSVEEAFGTEAVFGGVSEEDLRTMADDVVTANEDFPLPVPKNSIIFADCDLTFTTDRPLRLSNGAAIIYVTGNVYIQNGVNPCYCSGFLYVKGNFHMEATSVLRGQLVTKGSVTVSSSSDAAEVEYDESILNNLMEEIGQYRISKATIDPETREN